MKQEEHLFLKLLADILHPDSFESSEPFDYSLWQSFTLQLLTLARQHKILPPVYEFLCRHDIELPTEQKNLLRTEISTYVLSCHQMSYFSNYVCNLLDKNNIPYALLKGTTLTKLYPKPEYRRYGDVDILVNDDFYFSKAADLLTQAGFNQQQSTGDHHFEFTLSRQGRTYLLELHRYTISNQNSDTLNDSINRIYDSVSLSKPLSATLEALYLLLHMLQHLLNAGFGVKLLCDWVVYIEAYGTDIDNQELTNLLQTLHLTTFAQSITAFCVQYLGLKSVPACLICSMSSTKRNNVLEALAEDIFSGGEYGSFDSSRMIIMRNSSHFIDYCRELHRQMRKGFPSFSKFPLCWPVLWLITGGRFLYNNHHLRHASMRQILKTTKKRQSILNTLDIKL